MIQAMSDLQRRSGSRPSRRKREQRAYTLVMVGGLAGLVAVVTGLLALFTSFGWGIPILAVDRRRALLGDVPPGRPLIAQLVLVAEAIGRALAAHGVDTVFGLLGSGNLTVTNALRDSGARFVATRHECGAICAADGYARVSGRLAACSVHQGPGLTNTITGLTEAAKSRTPVLLLAADTPSAALRSNFRIDQAALVESVGAVAERVHGPDTAMADVARAVRRARVERRAVVLMLPLDVQAGDCDPSPPAAGPGAGPGPPRRRGGRGGRRDPARRAAPRDRRGPRRRARRRRTGAPAPRRAHRRGARHLRGRQRPVRRRPVRGRDRRRLLVADRRPAARRGRRGDRVRRRAQPVDDPPRHAVRPRRRGVVQVDRDEEAIGAHRPVDLGVVGDAAATADALLAALDGHTADAAGRDSRTRSPPAPGGTSRTRRARRTSTRAR